MAILLVICALPALALAAEPVSQETMEKAAEKAVEKSAEKAVEKALEKALGEALGKSSEKAVERVVEKAVEKVAEEETQKSELSAERPDEWKGATKVHFIIFVLDIDDIDGSAQSFTANVFVRLRWQDERLANPDSSQQRRIPLDEIWNPGILLANQKGLVPKSLPEVALVSPDGMVVYRQRYTGELSQPLNLAEFPMDRHTFTIQFVSAGYSADDLEFVPDRDEDSGVVGGAIADQLSLPDWELVKFEALPFPYRPIAEINTPGFAFQFEAKRFFTYYFWRIVLPLTVVIVMSWAAFWVDRRNVSVRISVATSSILTLIAHRFILASLLPRLPYMTRMDYFTVGSTLMVFVALIVVVMTSFMASKDRYDLTARKINIGSRYVFPVAFFLLLGWFVFS
jgi:hypothetical protein